MKSILDGGKFPIASFTTNNYPINFKLILKITGVEGLNVYLNGQALS